MEFIDKVTPDVKKPLIIAAMQDMGNVGSIVVNFINKNLKTIPFREVKSTRPPYVYDKGGYIEIPDAKWEYRYGNDVIIFGGKTGQPQQNDELNEICQDVIFGSFPLTYVTTTSNDLFELVKKLNIETTPQESVITGFNGLILGYAKLNEINGIGLYGELLDPDIPQFRAAKSILRTLEKLTYRKFGDMKELDMKAESVDEQLRRKFEK